MKKNKTIVLILIFLITIIFPLTINASEYQINPENYHSDGPEAADVKDMYKFGGSVAGVIQIVGTIVSVGVMMLLGIRYMVASADEKAEYKERLLPYLIGCVLLFGATNIVKIAYRVNEENSGSDVIGNKMSRSVLMHEYVKPNSGGLIEMHLTGGEHFVLEEENDLTYGHSVYCYRCDKKLSYLDVYVVCDSRIVIDSSGTKKLEKEEYFMKRPIYSKYNPEDGSSEYVCGGCDESYNHPRHRVYWTIMGEDEDFIPNTPTPNDPTILYGKDQFYTSTIWHYNSSGTMRHLLGEGSDFGEQKLGEEGLYCKFCKKYEKYDLYLFCWNGNEDYYFDFAFAQWDDTQKKYVCSHCKGDVHDPKHRKFWDYYGGSNLDVSIR